MYKRLCYFSDTSDVLYYYVMECDRICFRLSENTCFPVLVWNLNVCVLRWSSLLAPLSEHIQTTWPYSSILRFKKVIYNYEEFWGPSCFQCIQHNFKWTFRGTLQSQDLPLIKILVYHSAMCILNFMCLYSHACSECYFQK